METITSEKVNDLRVSIDWIALTCNEEVTTDTLVEDLGFTSEDFQKLNRGANGYRKQLKHNLHSIRILYDGGEDMGVHLIVSGSAISSALKSFLDSQVDVFPVPVFGGSGVPVEEFGLTEMQRFLSHLSSLGHFTRLDIAVDDLNNVGLSPDEASSLVCNGQCVSRFRTCRHTKETDYQGTKKGQTIYFGSGQSNFLVRLYDKKLEQESKGKTVDSSSWYRWELELKKEYADRTARSIAGGIAVGSIGVGILTYYLRFINLDNNVRSRCTMYDKWSNFVKDALSCGLYVPPPAKKIQHKRQWIDKQVAPSLAAVFVASGSDVNVLYDIINSGWERAKKPLKAIANEELNTMQLTPYTEYLMDCHRIKEMIKLTPLQMEIAEAFEEEMFGDKSYYRNGELLPLPFNSFKRSKKKKIKGARKKNDTRATCKRNEF